MGIGNVVLVVIVLVGLLELAFRVCAFSSVEIGF